MPDFVVFQHVAQSTPDNYSVTLDNMTVSARFISSPQKKTTNMNIYQLHSDREVFKFEMHNLNLFHHFDPTVISGHYTFWFHLPTRRYVFCKHGDYHNLVSIRPVEEAPRWPSAKEREFLDGLVSKEIRGAYFYAYAKSYGPFLLPKLEAACEKGKDTCGSIRKNNCIFDEHQWEGPEWDAVRNKDTLAIQLLTGTEILPA